MTGNEACIYSNSVSIWDFSNPERDHLFLGALSPPEGTIRLADLCFTPLQQCTPLKPLFPHTARGIHRENAFFISDSYFIIAILFPQSHGSTFCWIVSKTESQSPLKKRQFSKATKCPNFTRFLSAFSIPLIYSTAPLSWGHSELKSQRSFWNIAPSISLLLPPLWGICRHPLHWSVGSCTVWR